jgi:hypothetical protein
MSSRTTYRTLISLFVVSSPGVDETPEIPISRCPPKNNVCGGTEESQPEHSHIPNLVNLPSPSAHNSPWLVNEHNPLSPNDRDTRIVLEYAFKVYI